MHIIVSHEIYSSVPGSHGSKRQLPTLHVTVLVAPLLNVSTGILHQDHCNTVVPTLTKCMEANNCVNVSSCASVLRIAASSLRQ